MELNDDKRLQLPPDSYYDKYKQTKVCQRCDNIYKTSHMNSITCFKCNKRYNAMYHDRQKKYKGGVGDERL